MFETVLACLHNWFPARGGIRSGTFSIREGVPDVDFLQDGQYYRIKGSVFSDGLHIVGEQRLLRDEEFVGEIWALAVPEAVVKLAEEIADWRAKNPESDKASESFGGYSYNRGSSASGALGGWQLAFSDRLNVWRRPYD